MIQRTQNSDAFQAARRALDAGDTERLAALLAQHPGVVHERAVPDDAHYAGYFAHATLLHHIAGNPIRGPYPDNMVAVAAVLLDAGAEVDAVCGGGPRQPDSTEWTPLGLVASGMVPEQKGLAADLIDLLVDAGADVNHAQGMNVWAALFHTVEHKAQRDVAAMLAQRGARLDLAYAAGLGDRPAVESFFHPDGSLVPEAYGRWRPRDNRLVAPGRDAILAEALCFAALAGRLEVAGWLLEQGADGAADVAIVGERATALHYAVWGDWLDVVQHLVARGLPLRRRDLVHDTSVLGWALFLDRHEVAEWLANQDDAIDLRDAVALNRVDLLEDLLGEQHPDTAFGDGDAGVLLRMAAAEGSVDALHWLLWKGADSSLANREGKTALDYARERGHREVVALLERIG